tara:strand:+ start:241 stop:927 length:687 start_codon:yes stop_codon:yes gene_type:complete
MASLTELIHILNDDDEYVVLDLFSTLFDSYPTKMRKKVNKKRKRKTYIERDRQEGYNRIYYNYLSIELKYPESLFRRRFRMSSSLFKKIFRDLPEVDIFLTEMTDAVGRRGVSPLQKIVAALRMLCYGESADRQDEYIQIGQTTARAPCVKFCRAVTSKYGKQYLRDPTQEDLRRILQVNTIRGFPGMIGKEELSLVIIITTLKFTTIISSSIHSTLSWQRIINIFLH